MHDTVSAMVRNIKEAREVTLCFLSMASKNIIINQFALFGNEATNICLAPPPPLPQQIDSFNFEIW